MKCYDPNLNLYTHNNSLQSDQPKRKMTLLNANRISGDGHRHTIKALAFPNTTSQYTNQIPVCGSMRLASTPIVAAVLLDYKAKASPLPDSSIKHVRKMPQTELDNDYDMPRPDSPFYRHEPSPPALPNAETFTTPKPNMIAFAAPIAHSNPQCSKAF